MDNKKNTNCELKEECKNLEKKRKEMKNKKDRLKIEFVSFVRQHQSSLRRQQSRSLRRLGRHNRLRKERLCPECKRRYQCHLHDVQGQQVSFLSTFIYLVKLLSLKMSDRVNTLRRNCKRLL